MTKPIRPIPKIELKYAKNFDPIARDWRVVRSRYVLSHKNHAIEAGPETIGIQQSSITFFLWDSVSHNCIFLPRTQK